MKHILALLFMLCSVFVNAEEIWIDVRTIEEFEAGHLAQVNHLIPYDEVRNSKVISELDRNSEVLLYCRSGQRASVARKALMDLGFTNVVNMGSLENARQYVQTSSTKP